MRKLILTGIAFLFLLSMMQTRSRAAAYNIHGGGRYPLADGGGAIKIPLELYNYSTTQKVYITDASVVGVDVLGSYPSLADRAGGSCTAPVILPPATLDKSGNIVPGSKTSPGYSSCLDYLFDTSTDNSFTQIPVTVTLYGGLHPTDHDTLGTITFDLVRQYFTINTNSVSYPNTGGIFPVYGSIYDADTSGNDDYVFDYDLPLPSGVQIFFFPSLLDDVRYGGPLDVELGSHSQPLSVDYHGLSYPLFFVQIPPNTPSFSTTLTLKGNNAGRSAGVANANPVGQSGAIQFTNLGNLPSNVYGWGSDNNSLLGDYVFADRNTPQLVVGLPVISSIACGDSASVALASNGDVWVWGMGFRLLSHLAVFQCYRCCFQR